MADKVSKCDGLVESLLKGMDTALSTKTVVGEPTQIGDTIIVPLVDVSFGFGAGTGNNGQKNSSSAGGGLGGKMTPNAVLVIKNGTTKMVSVKSDTMTKLVDMLPDLIDKFTSKKEDELSNDELVDIAFPDED